MTERIKWVNPHTGVTHTVGQRVMWVDGRINYAETGSIGTVIAVPGDGGDKFVVRLDASKARKKRKSDPNPEPRIVDSFTTDQVLPFQETIRRTVERLRAVADDYERVAAEFDADSVPLNPKDNEKP